MSDRDKTPTSEALAAWRKSVDAAISQLQLRPIGSPNGLIVKGGGAGTWTPITVFSGTWSATTVAGQQAPAWALDANGFVHLRGHVKNTVSFAAGAICTLPLAPPALENFATPNGGGAGPGISQISVAATGVVSFANLVGNGWNATNWMSLSGISFYVGSQ